MVSSCCWYLVDRTVITILKTVFVLWCIYSFVALNGTQQRSMEIGCKIGQSGGARSLLASDTHDTLSLVHRYRRTARFLSVLSLSERRVELEPSHEGNREEEPRREETAWRDPLALTAAGRDLLHQLSCCKAQLTTNIGLPLYATPLIRSARHFPPALNRSSSRLGNIFFFFFFFFLVKEKTLYLYISFFFLIFTLKRNTL